MFHVNTVIAKDPVEVGKLAADQFEAVLRVKPACVIGLATGSTPPAPVPGADPAGEGRPH